jgi:ABC-type Fe3+/spermidine/putrescine transport system ATPase subunit
MTDLLTLRAIRKEYGAVVALDGIDLRIREGEFVSLLGPSGCGKTTMLRLIGGFVQPDSGQLLVNGRDYAGVPPYRRDFVNTVFQDYALFPHLTIGENVAFGLKYKRMAKSDVARTVEETLGIVGLQTRRDAYPSMLSGGQRQRVALARALALKPQLLLLDEPLSALDAKLREEMQIELKRLHRSLGITFVFVTHSQQEALVMSDRVVLMNHGRIEQEDVPERMYAAPATLFAARFMGERSFLRGRIDSRAGEGGGIASNGYRFEAAWIDPRLKAGDEAMVMIGPEHVVLAESGGLPTTVTEHLYLGQLRRTIVKLGQGETIAFDRASHEARRMSEIGSTIGVRIMPEGVRAYPAADVA